jgi:hypothetical protein
MSGFRWLSLLRGQQGTVVGRRPPSKGLAREESERLAAREQRAVGRIDLNTARRFSVAADE